MSGSFFTGLLSGFNEAADANRAAAAREREAALQRDKEIFMTLAGHDNPEIANRAAEGLLTLSTGKYEPGKGLSKLLGRTGPGNPDMQGLLDTFHRLNDHLSQQQQQAADADIAEAHPGAAAMAPPPETGSGPTAVQLAPPPPPPGPLPIQTTGPLPGRAGDPTQRAAAAAGAPQTGPVGGVPAGAPPPPLPTSYPASPKPTPPPTTKLRLFESPEVKAERAAAGAERGRVIGQKQALLQAGFSDEESNQILKDDMLNTHYGGSGASPYQAVDGEVPDPNRPGMWIPTKATFDRTSGKFRDLAGNVLNTFRRSSTTGSVSFGQDREAIARAFFGGRSFAQLAPAEQQEVVRQANAMGVQQTADKAGAGTAARMDAEAAGPLSTQQQSQLIQQLTDRYIKIDAPTKVMRQQLDLMETGLQRLAADPVGASESVRVTFEKILDPLSVVREAEYARQGSGLSLIDRVIGQIQALKEGGGPIPIQTLAGLVETARNFVAISSRDNERDIALIRRQAVDKGIDPGLVIPTAPTMLNPRQGMQPPVPPPTAPGRAGTAPPPGVEPNLPKGTFVGNPYTGPTGRKADGTRWGKDEQGNPIELVEHNGVLYVK